MDCHIETENSWFRYRAVAIIIKDNCVLMAKNASEPYYYTVGGGVKINETAESAVIREAFEETGEVFEIDRLAFIHENFFTGTSMALGKKCHEVAFYFIMKPKDIIKFNKKSYNLFGEMENVEWINLDEYSSMFAHPVWLADEIKKMGENIKHIITQQD